MMKTKKIMCTLLLTVFVFTAVNTVAAPKPKVASWTFMVYMVADNNLYALPQSGPYGNRWIDR
jgi:hypothetical protein